MMHESGRVRTRCFRALDLAQCRNQAPEDAVIEEEEPKQAMQHRRRSVRPRRNSTVLLGLRQSVLTGT